MCRVICAISCKGGCGKTTLAANIGSYIGKINRVLAVDLDPQHSLTTHLGIQQSKLNGRLTITDVIHYFTTEAENWDENQLASIMQRCIIHTENNVDIIPSTTRLAGLQKALPSVPECERLLGYALSSLHPQYDYILLDCHSGFDLYAQNALAASDSVIIPVEANKLCTDGVNQVLPIIRGVQRRINPELSIAGIAFNRYKDRTNNTRQYRELITREFGEDIRIFRSVIKERTVISEAPDYGTSIFFYKPKSDSATAFASLAEEVMTSAQYCIFGAGRGRF